MPRNTSTVGARVRVKNTKGVRAQFTGEYEVCRVDGMWIYLREPGATHEGYGGFRPSMLELVETEEG